MDSNRPAASLQHSDNQQLEEEFFNLLERINHYRNARYEVDFLVPHIQKLGGLAEALFEEWLRAIIPGINSQSYLFLVVPYLSFRLLNGQMGRPVSFIKASSAQKKSFLDVFTDDMLAMEDMRDVRPERRMFRAFNSEILDILLEFLESLSLKRLQ